MRWKIDVCGPTTTTMMSKARLFHSFADKLGRLGYSTQVYSTHGWQSTALFVATAPLAYAEQAASHERLTAADLENLTDARIEIVKAALQLTPDGSQWGLRPPRRGASRP